MFNQLKLSVLIIVFLISCSESKEPVLRIGKNLDKENMTVSEETDKFTNNDKLAYLLTTPTPFKSNKITRSIYKGKVYRDLVNRESIDLEIAPNTTQLSDVMSIHNIVRRHGWGHFMLIFVMNETVIAKKAFIITKSKQGVRPPVKQRVKPAEQRKTTNDKKTEINSRPEMSKPMSPSLSPSEMMNE